MRNRSLTLAPIKKAESPLTSFGPVSTNIYRGCESSYTTCERTSERTVWTRISGVCRVFYEYPVACDFARVLRIALDPVEKRLRKRRPSSPSF